MGSREISSTIWATIVYPESALKGWEDSLVQRGLQFFVSPLHDRDLDKDGKVKKPHYHVMFIFKNKRGLSTVDRIVRSIGGVGCEIVENGEGYARYLTHENAPEKVKYDKADVRSFGGIDYRAYLLEKGDDRDILSEVLEFIERHNCLSYYKLTLYASRYRKDWFYALSGKYGAFLKEYIKSRAYEASSKGGLSMAVLEIESWAEKEGESVTPQTCNETSSQAEQSLQR